MWLNKQLTWHSHIQKLILKIKRNKYLLQNARHMMDVNTKKLVYHSHISSHIQYGLVLWGNNAGREQINKLQKLQTQCLELIQKEKDPNKALGILTIDSMIKLENLKFGYKLLHQMLPPKINEACLVDNNKQSLNKTHQYSTRNKNVPNLPKIMNKLYRDSFLCKGPQAIMTLSVETKEKRTLKSFSKSCKNQLINQY